MDEGTVSPVMVQLIILALEATALVAIADAVLSFIVFYRFRKGRAPKFLSIGYLLVAIALGGFNVGSRVLFDLGPITRFYINAVGVFLLLLGKSAHFIGLLDLYQGVKPVGLSIGFRRWRIRL